MMCFLGRLDLRYTFPRIHLQTFVNCLDHRDIASDTVKQGCVRLRDALKCISETIFTVIESRTAN